MTRRGDKPSRASRSAYSTWTVLTCAVLVAALVIGAGQSLWPLQPHLAQTLTDDPPFRVVDLPGRGKGLVATRDIQQGELLIRERPILRIPQQIDTSPTAYLEQILSGLSDEDRRRFYDLSFVHLSPDLHDDPLQVALAIVQTNAVSAGPAHIGVFPTMARLNHACAGAFNSVYSWREGEGVLVVHALKGIGKGQASLDPCANELLTTYTDSKRKRDDRRNYLSSQYAFNCTCAVCSLPEPASRASDRCLEAMTHLYSKFASWGAGAIDAGAIDGREAVDVARAIWKLGDEEGYWSERGRLAGDVVWVAAAHSDIGALREWARVAVEWYGYELGEDSEQVKEMEEVMLRPEKHRAWATRTEMTVGGT
ncbi:hypothetical protein NEOLEDRAFT_1086618 [Neolentinus lepideus HHB14362 ss-1]|uniref:SET domain-containing protein n=1 Tax=Neolentinus lepideus HHB14362 ss-1 TaxID=1314782 RepID=A0A165UYA4_9AGAM|nr:hypothetical protein NEOLEDRAFT_1086618 [Neolentinus lepideus HHB14362 ss-1]